MILERAAAGKLPEPYGLLLVVGYIAGSSFAGLLWALLTPVRGASAGSRWLRAALSVLPLTLLCALLMRGDRPLVLALSIAIAGAAFYGLFLGDLVRDP